AMMGDGKALQMGTSHELGQNFGRAFGTQYSTESGGLEYVWQTSWGCSTRLIGALVMVHGDDFGLRLPPTVAPVQAVVLLVREEEGVRRAAEALVDELRSSGVRAELDDRVEVSFGRRSVGWEIKGVPSRVEVGTRDLAEGKVTLVRRHTRDKRAVDVSAAAAEVVADLAACQRELLAEAEAMRASRTRAARDLGEAASAAADGFALLPWSEVGESGEKKLAESGVTVRCIQREDGSLASSDDEAGLVAIVAKAY
ncbi:MAG: His/Gly/Thr/Pro-type tRNA ligase C-terminal domain-containing protein, partial [Acidimicrobiales bacterium]